jgi:hypothetical protein
MKKSALFLLAGGLLTFAACTNEQAPAGGYTQEQVDSAVNARVLELQAAMQATNDSTINALAQWKADSMIAAAKGGTTIKSTTTKTSPGKTSTTTTTTTTAPPPKTNVQTGGLKSQSDQNKVNDKSSVQGGGLKSQSDQNKTNNTDKVQGGGLKSQSDQNKTK